MLRQLCTLWITRRKDDVIVLMGKGHETYQIVGAEKRHLDEREIVAAHWKQTHDGL